MMLTIDHLPDIIAAGIVVLAALGMILWFAMRRRIKAGKNGLEVGAAAAEEAPPLLCEARIAVEHSELLTRLTAVVEALAPQLAGINQMLQAHSEGFDVLLGLAEGDQINGQVKKARNSIARAQGFKDAADQLGGQA
jgi:hypothetical protein